MFMRSTRVYLHVFLAVATAGCASPSTRYTSTAQAFGFTVQHVAGPTFAHVEFWSRHPVSGQPLHVYFEGDGSPWVGRHRIATDPTPRRQLALHLMRNDPAPSVLIGRPCYHGLAGTSPCTPRSWTEQRYSPQIVAAMTAAVIALRDRHPDSPMTLIGYSGGGALARLIAARIEPDALVTIAANLDTDVWNAAHGNPALSDSLNPATLPPLPDRVRQLHLAGERDDNVPPALIRAAIAREGNARFRVIADFDHDCCWADLWPEPLESLP